MNEETIVPELKRIRKCTKRCKVFPCIYVDMSFSEKFGGNCALKQMPYTTQRRLFKLYLGGKEGIMELIDELQGKITKFDVDKQNQRIGKIDVDKM